LAADLRRLALTLGWLLICAWPMSARVLAAESLPQVAPTQPPSVVAAPSPVPPAPIPIERIAPSIAQTAHLLRVFSSQRVPGGAIEAIGDALPAVSAEFAADLERTLSMLQEQPSLEALQGTDQLWSSRQLALNAWLEILTGRVTRLQETLTQIAALRETWTLTREAAAAGGAPAPMLNQIDATLAQLAAAEPLDQARRDEALDLQGAIAREVARCETVRTRIQEVQQGTTGGLLARTSRPLWDPDLWRRGLAVLQVRAHQVYAAYQADLSAYLTNPATHMPVHLGVFVVVLATLLAARRRLPQCAAAGGDMARISIVFDRPVAAAALIALIAATTLWSPTPLRVKELLGALALVPMIVLVRPRVDRSLRPTLYALGLLFALDSVHHAFGGVPPVVGQVMIFGESLAAVGVVLRLFRHLKSAGGGDAASQPALHWVWRPLTGGVLVTLIIGLVASLFGRLELARLTTPAVLVGAADALWIYAAVEVSIAILAFALRTWPLQRLRLVANHREWLLSRFQRWFLWLAVLAWCFRYLDYLGLWQPTLTLVQQALAVRLTLGAFSTSAGDVLAFGLTLWAAYLVSAVLRFILEEEVYPRAGIATGVSYAASSLIQYTIGILAFFLALGFLGITLTQVTVFAGALGVGIGLGLQNVVQNFVAGLILLFEQPIHVGDAVQVGDLQGRVRRIGIRASVLRTLQGAEVIIPNSELTSNQVTNWTLSDQQRRLELPVGLAYGTAPAQVIALLEGVARDHPGVLPEPPPRCLFVGYGDSAINFELRVWADYDAASGVSSELAAAVYDAVNAAGLSFPFPQREVRLLADEKTSE
jgi:small-conductance mechanosensitive channel